jgi:hypothetical protein
VLLADYFARGYSSFSDRCWLRLPKASCVVQSSRQFSHHPPTPNEANPLSMESLGDNLTVDGREAVDWRCGECVFLNGSYAPTFDVGRTFTLMSPVPVVDSFLVPLQQFQNKGPVAENDEELEGRQKETKKGKNNRRGNSGQGQEKEHRAMAQNDEAGGRGQKAGRRKGGKRSRGKEDSRRKPDQDKEDGGKSKTKTASSKDRTKFAQYVSRIKAAEGKAEKGEARETLRLFVMMQCKHATPVEDEGAGHLKKFLKLLWLEYAKAVLTLLRVEADTGERWRMVFVFVSNWKVSDLSGAQVPPDCIIYHRDNLEGLLSPIFHARAVPWKQGKDGGAGR